jgi:hypothetical protein
LSLSPIWKPHCRLSAATQHKQKTPRTLLVFASASAASQRRKEAQVMKQTRKSSSANDAQADTLVKKLVEVLADLGPVEKKHRNPHFGYNYVSEGQMMAELRERLSSRGIFLFTSVESIIPHYGEAKMGVFVCVQTKHTFFDAATKEQFVVGGAGVGWDSGDKGAYKAITGATKYALMKNFLVTDEQDPEQGEQAQPAKPGATGHKRTRAYEEETGAGDKRFEKDLLELKSFLTENEIPDGFLLRLLQEKKLIDGHTTSVAKIKPGIIRRVLDKKSLANLIKAWAAQTADADSGSATPPARNGKKEVRTREGDQTRDIVRKPVSDDISPADTLEQEGIDDWRKVIIHFGDKKGTPLGKLTTKDLSWWCQNYHPKPWKGVWQDKDLLLDAALVLASMEMAGEA